MSPERRPDRGDIPPSSAAAEEGPASRAASSSAPKTQTCPHCKGKLAPHEAGNPHTADALHCESCGCCFTADLALRPGHPPCKASLGAEA